MRDQMSSLSWIEASVPNTFIPPVLFTPPSDWLQWVAELSGEERPRTTVSKNMNNSNGPGWAQWIALKAALMGYIENPAMADLSQIVAPECVEAARVIIDWSKKEEARQTREAFNAGRPIPIPLHVSIERFTSFVPVLHTGDGTNKYEAGVDRDTHRFEARHHAEAMGKAAQWYSAAGDRGVREREIAARRELANSRASKLPPIYLDLATLQLEYDGILLNEQGDLCAMSGWGHGFYVVCSSRWCYTLQVSPGPAAKLAFLSALEDNSKLLLRPQAMPIFAGLDSWQRDESNFRWEYGQVSSIGDSKWRVVWKNAVVAIAHIQNNQLNLTGPKNKPLLSSAIPGSWKEAGVEPLLAWAVWRLAKRAREKDE